MRISIITITFNSAETLRDTFESVMRQGYTDFEHVVVDGASKDETVSLIEEYAQRYAEKGLCMRWVSERDKGIYDAMNKGIRMATGDVVGTLNSDDFYTSEDALQKVAETFTAHPEIDAMYGDVHYVDQQDLTKSVRYYSSKKFRRWRMRMGWMPAHPSFFLKKSTYEHFKDENGEYYDSSYRVAADFEFLLRTIFVGRIKTLYVKKDFVTMRTGGASTSGIKSHLRILKDHRRAFKKNGVYWNLPLQLSRYVEKLKEYFHRT